MSLSALPPRPDPTTGEPRPPRAPVEADDGSGAGETNPGRRPTKLPAGQGPMLEWYRYNNRLTLVGGALGVLIVFTPLLLDGDGPGLLATSWGIGASVGIALLTGLILYFGNRSRWVAAGANWVASNTGWVDVYELTEIKTRVDVGVLKLCLTDAAERKMDTTLSFLQENRRLWDLVYNGMLHSIRDRDVETDHNARLTLQLHGPLVVREVLDRRSREDDESAIAKKRPKRGRLYRRGRRQR